ncbi:MAG: recombinase RecA [Elusimicrobia bacterium RIFCSPLOWO2_01_FULL_54_10]|nr:MAG: recombinase RecA [Elusimicrobia bacterium RIFCSPLOWO2_01_FULL_54_10]
MNKDDRSKALELALSQIKKDFGQEAVMRMGEKSSRVSGVGVISTGILPLDIAIGIGGVPRGRIVEIYGPESSGKTTLCLSIVAQAQKAGGIAAYIDAEHAMDPGYAKKLGVDVDNLFISQPDSGEQALEITEKLIRSGAMDVIVIDSVAALVPQAEIAGDMGDAHVGLQARLMSQALRKLTSTISKSNTCLIFINQLRQKVGVFYGNPETTTGGLALKFYASVRLDIRAKEKLKIGDVIIGNRTVVKVVKNKVAPPFQVAEFEMILGEGVSREGTLLDVGEQTGILEKSGTWYLYGTERLGQGKDNAKTFLKGSPQIANAIEKAIREKAFSQNGHKEAEPQKELAGAKSGKAAKEK